MPPYGTPPPFAAMYPHGGIYSMPPVSDVVLVFALQNVNLI